MVRCLWRGNYLGLPQRGNLAPLTAFTGREPDSPLLNLVTGVNLANPLDFSRAQQLVSIQELCASVEAIHKRAHDSAETHRATARENKPSPTRKL
jgi:hypothetical protein